MKNRLLTLAGTLALLAVLGKFYAVPVLAQVRAALVKNIDERGRNPYIQHLGCFSNGTQSCTAFFPTVPANKRLVIEHVDGTVQTPDTLFYVSFAGNSAITQFAFFPLQSTDPSNFKTYVASQPFLTYAEAGQT